MRIESYLDITPEEITSRAHNIWLGISLGNKYFTKENIEKYIYKHNSSCIYAEFIANKSFHDLIVDIVNIGREDRMEKILKMTDVEMNRFCEYVLNELPHFINGVEIDNSDQIFTVIPYPGLSKLNELSVGLNNKTMFPELSSKLKITNHTGIVEAYVE
jgi:hypothetical protein